MSKLLNTIFNPLASGENVYRLSDAVNMGELADVAVKTAIPAAVYGSLAYYLKKAYLDKINADNDYTEEEIQKQLTSYVDSDSSAGLEKKSYDIYGVAKYQGLPAVATLSAVLYGLSKANKEKGEELELGLDNKLKEGYQDVDNEVMRGILASKGYSPEEIDRSLSTIQPSEGTQKTASMSTNIAAALGIPTALGLSYQTGKYLSGAPSLYSDASDVVKTTMLGTGLVAAGAASGAYYLSKHFADKNSEGKRRIKRMRDEYLYARGKDSDESSRFVVDADIQNILDAKKPEDVKIEMSSNPPEGLPEKETLALTPIAAI